MNLYFVMDDDSIVTPELGTILEGITRESILALAGEICCKVEERRISLDVWREGVACGGVRDVLASGCAAVVTPVGRLVWGDGELVMTEDDQVGPVTSRLRQELLDVQHGRREDAHGWLHRVV